MLAPASALAAAPTAAGARPSAKVAPKRHHAAQPRRGRTLPPVSDHGEALPLDLGSSKAPKTAGPSAGGGSIVRTLLGLGVVIALIYGVAWVMRQLKEGREGRVRGAGLASVSAVPLGANRSVHLVRAGRDYLLLGVAEQGVVHLRSYGEDEARAAGLLDDAPEPPARGGGDGPVRAVRLSPQALLQDLRDRTVRR